MIQHITTVDRNRGFVDITLTTLPGGTPHRVAYLRDAGRGTNQGWWCTTCGTRCPHIREAQELIPDIEDPT